MRSGMPISFDSPRMILIDDENQIPELIDDMRHGGAFLVRFKVAGLFSSHRYQRCVDALDGVMCALDGVGRCLSNDPRDKVWLYETISVD